MIAARFVGSADGCVEVGNEKIVAKDDMVAAAQTIIAKLLQRAALSKPELVPDHTGILRQITVKNTALAGSCSRPKNPPVLLRCALNYVCRRSSPGVGWRLIVAALVRRALSAQ
jgi:hypothetical protein